MKVSKLFSLCLAIGCTTTAFAGLGDFLKKVAEVTSVANGAVTNTIAVVQTFSDLKPSAAVTNATSAAAAPSAAAAATTSTATAATLTNQSAASTAVASATSLGLAEFRRGLRSDRSAVVFVVRAAGERGGRRMFGARPVTLETLEERISAWASDLNTPVYLCGRTAELVGQAGAMLAGKGYKHVYTTVY